MQISLFKNIKGNLNYYLLLMIAFILPLKKELEAPLIALFFLSTLIHFFSSKKKTKQSPTVFIILVFYLFTIAGGLIYGKNIQNTLFNAELKLSFFILPISFYLSSLDFNRIFPSIIKSFIEGCFVAVLLNLINSSFLFLQTKELTSFFYENASFFAHVSYYSYFLAFAIVSLYHLFFHPNKSNYIKPIHTLFLIVFFSLAILLGASKTGILSLLVIHLGAILYWLIRHKKIKQGVLALSSLILVLSIGIKSSPFIQERLGEMFLSIKTFQHKDLKPNSSTAIRIVTWREAANLIKERPILGYGVGDVSSELTKKYKQKKYDNLVRKHLNSHNQFFQTTLSSGIVGLLYFLFMLFFPLSQFRSYRFIYFGFLTITIINFSTESMLETQSGVVFFAFFLSLFYLLRDKGVANAQ